MADHTTRQSSPVGLILKPRPGYTLVPALHAVAQQYGLSISELAMHLALPLDRPAYAFSRLPHWTSTDSREVARAFAITPEALEACTVTWLRQRMQPSATTQSSARGDAAAALALNPFAPRLKICPQCLREGRPIRLVWQTNWGLVCLRHRALLVDRCPSCTDLIAVRRSLNRPAVGANVCGNQRTRGACTQNLLALPSYPVCKYPELLETQRVLEAALAGRAIRGVRSTPLSLLEDLHRLLELAWIVWPESQVGHVPAVCQSEFRAYAQARAHPLRERPVQASLDTLTVHARRMHGSVALNAVGLPIALEWLTLAHHRTIQAALITAIRASCFSKPHYPSALLRALERLPTMPDPRWRIALSDIKRWVRHEYHLPQKEVA